MMTRIKITLKPEQITRKVKTQIGNILKKNGIERVIKEEAIETIREDRLLLDDKSIKNVGDKWKNRRDQLSQANIRNQKAAKGNDSNLTFTGELLDKGLRGIFQVSKLRLILTSSRGKHKLYKRLKKSQGGRPKARKNPRKRASYKEIFDGQADQGRDAFKLGQPFLDRVTKRIIDIVEKNFS